MARVTNLVMNGRGKYTSGTVEVRRNLCLNPGARTSASGFGGFNGTNNARTFSVVQASWSDSGMAARSTYTNVQTNYGDFDARFYSGVTIGKTYTIVFRWSVSRSGIQIGIPRASTNNRNTEIVCTAASRASSVTAVAGEVYTDWATFVAPFMDNDPDGVRIYLSIRGHQSGDYIDSSMADIYDGEYQSNREWFDGSYSPDPDLTPSWTGTANSSASILTGQKVMSFGNTNAANYPYQSANHGAALVPSYTSSGDSAMYILGQNFGSDTAYLLPGKWYAAKISIYIDSPITKHSNRSLALIAQYDSTANWSPSQKVLAEDSSVENLPGDHTATITFQVPTDVEKPMVWILAYNGSKIPTDVVYFNNIIVAQADTEAEALAAVQTYFDGDFEPFRISSGNQLVIPKWSGTAGSSSSYYDWTEPYTLAATWDDVGQRTYELGCDRGVFYPPNGDGVLWNGLTAVNFSTENGDSTSYYHDGVKYFMNFPVGEFKGHLEAFTYPDEFMLYDGFSSPVDGMYLDEQQRKPFGLTYRTRVGDDQYGNSSFYRIHIMYNVYAVPSDKAYATISESPTASTFSWDLKTLPIAPGISGSYYSNTSHIVVDTRRFELSKIKALEEILYGDGADPGRLPLPAEVYSILNN